MEEPYGEFGAMNPTGHAAVYFNQICAETPTMLRPCHDGEYGVVISRYHKIDGYDWLAIPLVGYLYAVDSPSDIPVTVDKATGRCPTRRLPQKAPARSGAGQPARRSPKRRVDRTGR